MRFTMTVKMDNAAFEEAPVELERILLSVANKVSAGRTAGPIVDANGNTVGSFRITGRR